MGKGGDISAPAADPAIGQAALMQAKTGDDMLKFMQSAYSQSMDRQEETDALAAQVTNQQLSTSKQQAQWSKEDRARYTGLFQPMQDKYIEKASNWDSPERQAMLASEAKADVMGNAALTKKAGERNMASMGVNPNSGRFQGTDRASDLATGLAAAGAQNNARGQARTQALALQESAINLGNGLPASASNSAALGVSSGSTALGTNMAANGQFTNATGLMSQGYQGAMQGYSGQASTLNANYGNQLSAWSASQQAQASQSAGVGQAIGSIAGIAAMAMM